MLAIASILPFPQQTGGFESSVQPLSDRNHNATSLIYMAPVKAPLFRYLQCAWRWKVRLTAAECNPCRKEVLSDGLCALETWTEKTSGQPARKLISPKPQLQAIVCSLSPQPLIISGHVKNICKRRGELCLTILGVGIGFKNKFKFHSMN